MKMKIKMRMKVKMSVSVGGECEVMALAEAVHWYNWKIFICENLGKS